MGEVSNMAAAQNILVNGLSQEEGEELLQAVFEEVDVDGNGRLDPQEFVDALALSKLNLTDEDAGSLLASMETDESGTMSLDEFRPIAFQILTEILPMKLVPKTKCKLRVRSYRDPFLFRSFMRFMSCETCVKCIGDLTALSVCKNRTVFCLCFVLCMLP